MKSKLVGIFSLLLLVFTGCAEKMTEEEIADIGIIPCQRQPAFIKELGFDPARSAFSTSEKRMQGLVLIQLGPGPGDSTGKKYWQDPSWKQFGHLGPITTDHNGNVYTAPVPVINVLDNLPGKQNIIYRVDGKTGSMKPLTDLPAAGKPTEENPFGLLGLYFDCHGKKLYASSVAGSTRNQEKGKLFAVDPDNGKVIDELTGRDALGICVGGITGEKRLFFGSSRTSEVYSIELTKEGRFTGSARKELSLDLLGPRGDDKARRIRFDKNGDMMIFGVEFNFNLTAPTEKQETIYRFRYDPEEKKWDFVQ